MAFTTINKSSDYFNTVTYTGDGSASRNITGVGFQPDWVWGKCRNTTVSHALYDAVRGGSNLLNSNTTSAEGTNAALNAFISDGFTVNSDSYLNGNSNTYVAWNWKANGAGVANTDGSINSTVSVNTTSGFSIVSYTGNGTGNSTIGHGLGATPKFIIVKNLTTAQDWGTYSPSFVSASDPNILYLSKTSAQADDTNVWGTSATFNNNTFTVGDWNGSNQSGSSFIAYCFAEKKGFSKFGSYTGNGSTNGTFVYTGFKPAFVLIKNTAIVSSWILFDNKRSSSGGYNVNGYSLKPNVNNAEDTSAGNKLDLLSNGFKIRSDGIYEDTNDSGVKLIYMAFGQSLVGSNNIPCTAR